MPTNPILIPEPDPDTEIFAQSLWWVKKGNSPEIVLGLNVTAAILYGLSNVLYIPQFVLCLNNGREWVATCLTILLYIWRRHIKLPTSGDKFEDPHLSWNFCLMQKLVPDCLFRLMTLASQHLLHRRLSPEMVKSVLYHWMCFSPTRLCPWFVLFSTFFSGKGNWNLAYVAFQSHFRGGVTSRQSAVLDIPKISRRSF